MKKAKAPVIEWKNHIANLVIFTVILIGAISISFKTLADTLTLLLFTFLKILVNLGILK